MKTTILHTLFVAVAAVGTYTASAGPGLWSQGCVQGTLVCNGSFKFGICNMDSKVFWMAVADGTECVCSGSTCIITAVGPATSVECTPTPTTTPTLDSFNNNQALDPFISSRSNCPAPGHITKTPKSVVVHPPPNSAVVQDASPVVSSVATSSPPVAAATPTPPPSGLHSGSAYVRTFLGNGDPSQGWPQQSQWVDFESMWSTNVARVSKSCEAFEQINNSEDESAGLKTAIQLVAKSVGVDERFILAVVMQESGGCVRAPTSNYGVVNPGLMQSHAGAHSCYNVSPCPSSQIVGMIQDGTTGTSSGDGLQQILATAGSGVSRFYKTARIYNSGSIAASGLLQDGIATHCYASDIANRLIGWSVGVSGCRI